MKAAEPPGRPVMAAASAREKPDCVSPQAMPVAVPMISRIAPDRRAVSTSIGSEPPPVELAIDQQADDEAIDDADGRDLGRGRDAFDHGGADHERQRQRGQGDDEGAADLAGPARA